MTVRDALLSLVAESTRAGKAVSAENLRTRFHERSDNIWQLNMGQVTQSLDRLIRDDLVVYAGPRRTSTQTGRLSKTYKATEEGLAIADAWLQEPVTTDSAERDELTMKIIIALAAGKDVQPLIMSQRESIMESMRALRAMDDGSSRVETFLINRLIFEYEATLRFLDFVEENHGT